MNHQPPDEWTEKALSQLSDEDDRYEFKSGKLLSDNCDSTGKPTDKFTNELAEEICAFANSYGGTLFLGVENKNLEIGGISNRIGEKKGSLKDWLERKIPSMLEFRLPNFRLSEVKLSKVTQTRIGVDSSVIAIDVFESDLAPHQCKFNLKYYYRLNSSSEPAPNHYLAYLSGRHTPAGSELVHTWCSRFLNRTISDLAHVHERLFRRHFNGDVLYTSPQWLNNPDLIGEQFLRTFPKQKELLEAADNLGFNLQLEMNDFETEVESLSELDIIIKDELISRISGYSYDNLRDADPDSVAAWLCHTWGDTGVDKNGRVRLARYTARSFVRGQQPGISTEARSNWDGCTTVIVPKLSESRVDIAEKALLLNSRIDGVAAELGGIVLDLKEFRHELCLRHNTPYE